MTAPTELAKLAAIAHARAVLAGGSSSEADDDQRFHELLERDARLNIKLATADLIHANDEKSALVGIGHALVAIAIELRAARGGR